MRIGAFILSGLLFLPLTTLAAGIVPDCGLGASQYMCQACHLAALTHNILVWLVSLAVAAATLMFAYAGFLYVTAAANHGNIDSAKRIFGQVLLGLILVLTAWLIIDLTLRVFTNQSFQVLTTFQCVKAELVGGKFEFPESPVEATTGNPTPADIAQCAAGAGITHDAALARLRAAGVGVTSTSGSGGVRDGCSGKGCTTFTNICDGTVKGLEGIAKDNPCGAFTVWGGSEGGNAHGTNSWHGKGCAFDIAPNNVSQFSCLGNFLKQNSAKYGITQVCTTPTDSKYRVNCDYNEGPRHYHVTFCKK